MTEPIKKSISLYLIIVLVSIVALAGYLYRPNRAFAEWYTTGGTWNYRKSITIDHTKVPGSSNLTNFVVLVNLTTDSDLQANAQADGDDILFTSSNGTSKLDHEIEVYTTATGRLVAWVEVDSVDFDDNTIIYMYYGNSSATNQQNVTGTWSNGYEAVYHLNTVFTDSTSNGRDGADTGTADVTGIAGQARDFDGGSGDLIDIGTFSVVEDTFTMSCWVFMDSYNVDRDDRYISKADGIGAANHDWMLGKTDANGGSPAGEIIRGRINRNTGTAVGAVTPLPTTTWFYAAMTYDVDLAADLTVSVQLYQNGSTDGAEQDLGTLDGNLPNNTNAIYIGNQPTSATLAPDGRLDECRISNVIRSPDWLLTEYNNISDPANFYALGGSPENAPTTGSSNVKIRGGGAGTEPSVKIRGGGSSGSVIFR